MMTSLTRRRLLAFAAVVPFAARAAVMPPNPLVRSPYGPLAPVADSTTGMALLQLPAGFSYASFGWTGDLMDNGLPCPGKHDGMGVIRTRNDSIELVRNHEVGLGQDDTFFGAPSVYDRGRMAGLYANGGTTHLVFRNGRWQQQSPLLGGTLVNCAGGVTPWGSWLSCEELASDDRSSAGRMHGYVFENLPGYGDGAVPLVGLGRFKHEAAAVDPASGHVYMTEDDSGRAGLYRFIPARYTPEPGMLARGGRLQMARVRGVANADLTLAQRGARLRIDWVDIDEPDAFRGEARGPLGIALANASGPFCQGWAQGALRMNRGEGIAWHEGSVFIMDTAGGEVRKGSLWVYEVATQTLSCLYASAGMLFGDMGDNITVSPRGGLLLCEDPEAPPVDEFGTGLRLMGLTQQGEVFPFAKNHCVLEPAQLRRVGKHESLAGDHRNGEFCGACFDPSGRYLFVNAQDPGITYAITGPWERGVL